MVSRRSPSRGGCAPGRWSRAAAALCARAAPETTRGPGGGLLPLNQRGRCGRRSSPKARLSRRAAASFCADGPAGHLALVFYAYPMSRCIVCARGAAMPCHTALVICKGSRWRCRIARLYGRAAPVATAVCAGFADHRAELRLSPEVRSSRMTIGTLRKAGTGVRWISEPRLQSGSLRAPTITTPRRRRDSVTK